MKKYFLLFLPFLSLSMHAALGPELFTFPLQQLRQDSEIAETNYARIKRSSSCPDFNNMRPNNSGTLSSSTINIIYNGKNKVDQGSVKIDNSVSIKGVEFKPQLNVNLKVECAIL